MLDLTSLLEPISAEKPAGIDLRATANVELTSLKDARINARRQERDALYNEDHSTKDKQHWEKIIDLAPKILTKYSKDLTVACWLTEALTRIHGFSGVQAGFELLNGLIARYWDYLYPQEDEDGIVTKLSSLIGLNGENSEGTLIAPINSIALTKGSGIEVAVWEYQLALNYSRITDEEKLNQLLSDGVINLENITEAVLKTPISHFEELQATLENCLATYKNLTSSINALSEGNYVLPSSNIEQALTLNLETVKTFYRMIKPVNTANDTQREDSKNVASINFSKQQAFDDLLKIADLFRQHEPQSPVPYLLEQAVHWGSLALPDLLAEIIPEQQSLNFCLRLIGVRASNQNKKEMNNYDE